MMIILSHTHLTDRTVFRTSWLRQLASLTFVILTVDLPIVVLFIFFNIFAMILSCYFTRFCRTSFIVNPETNTCQDMSDDHLIRRDRVVRHMLKDPINDVASVAALDQ